MQAYSERVDYFHFPLLGSFQCSESELVRGCLSATVPKWHQHNGRPSRGCQRLLLGKFEFHKSFKACETSKPQMAGTVGAGIQDGELFREMPRHNAIAVGGTNSVRNPTGRPMLRILKFTQTTGCWGRRMGSFRRSWICHGPVWHGSRFHYRGEACHS